MKTTLFTLTLLSISFSSFAQNYQPFNEVSSKRFFNTDNTSDNDYFFHIDSSNIAGDSIIFNQYHPIENTLPIGMTLIECGFWGGTTGDVMDTNWLGNQLKWNSTTSELIAENELNEPLTFDFGLPIGSSAAFYSDAANIYLIEHSATILESFLGVSDSVKVFTISTTDSGGTATSSPIDAYEIKLSKNFGLISFINVYNFPNIQQGQELQGQTNPHIGDYQLTYDDSYPWQVNDVLQYSNYRSNGFNGPPSNSSYLTITVTDRIETIDSIKIYFSAIVYVQNPGTSVPYYGMSSAPILFKKGTPISEIPWNMSQSIYRLEKAVEDSVDHCGYFDRFKTQEYFAGFCDSCRCYGDFDGFGQTVEQVQYVKNYGLFNKSFSSYGPLGSTPSGSSSLIYSNVGGVECGTFWNSVDELPTFNLSVFPNPTKDKLQIESDQLFDEIRITDLSGRLIFELDNIHQKTVEFSLASFQKGAYILEVSVNGSVQTQTIIRE